MPLPSEECDSSQIMVDYGLCYGLITDVDYDDAVSECEDTYNGILALTETVDKLDFLTGNTIFDGER